MAELLYTDDFGDSTQQWWKEDGNLTITTVGDVQPLIEDNQRRYNDAPERFGNDTFHEVARMDGQTIERLAQRHNMTFAELMDARNPEAAAVWSRFLNDRDTRAFRTRPGHVVMKAR